ncbi:MAG TPA: DUF4203 domain-containing protein [Lacunisphaera sp.]|nr:DUF4203 domain-containing protein [Lacunisphaera sp.]
MDDLTELYPWLSAGAIAWGALDVFFGYRIFKITLALFGGLLGLAAGHALAVRFGFTEQVGLIVMVVGALLGAGLAFLLYIAAVFVAGFGFGATLGMLLLANYHHMVALLAGVVLGIVGGFLAVKVQRVLIILSTALLGSFRAVLALSYFTARTDWLFYFRQPDQMPALIDEHPWMFPSILALAAVGVVAQLELGGGKEPKKAKAADKK